ncbi:MAG: DHCW motif cupin fold protein [Alphaproteobacteria bacterium]
MQIAATPFTAIDWAAIAPTEHPGDSGVAVMHTLQAGGVRIRRVTYSPGYVADHWCDLGHVAWVVAGGADIALKDGRRFRLDAGMAFAVSDHGDAAHRVETATGATLFIVD